jgi:hypothetical protein
MTKSRKRYVRYSIYYKKQVVREVSVFCFQSISKVLKGKFLPLIFHFYPLIYTDFMDNVVKSRQGRNIGRKHRQASKSPVRDDILVGSRQGRNIGRKHRQASKSPVRDEILVGSR